MALEALAEPLLLGHFAQLLEGPVEPVPVQDRVALVLAAI
jgi:hypothetical protein